MAPKEPLRIVAAPEGGGWAWARIPEVPNCDLWFRVAEIGGRLGIVALEIVPESGTIDAGVLRSIPTGRIEALANQPTMSEVLREAIAQHGGEADQRDWVTRAERAAADPTGALAALQRGPLRVRGARERSKPDGFYAKVAELYSRASYFEGSPAQAIADANNVPVTTVHGWVKEARRRGLLAPGRRER